MDNLWKLRILSGVLFIAGLFMTGIIKDIFAIINGDTSSITIPSTIESFGSIFMFASPIIFRLSGSMKGLIN